MRGKEETKKHRKGRMVDETKKGKKQERNGDKQRKKRIEEGEKKYKEAAETTKEEDEKKYEKGKNVGVDCRIEWYRIFWRIPRTAYNQHSNKNASFTKIN